MAPSSNFESLVFKSSRPKPMGQPPPRRILSSAGKRLSTIMENGNAPQQAAPSRNPFHMKFLAAESPLRKSIDKGSSGSEATSPSSEKEAQKGLAENRHIARRGGWKRLALLLLLLVLTLLALGLGLGLGLTRKTHTSSTATPASDSSSPPAGSSSAVPSTNGVPPSSPSFPQGIYSLETYLTTVQTNCSANPATWTCFPYATYSANAASSLATFNWAIGSSSPSNHSVSAPSNPFAISFSSEPLTLLDAGQATERYALNFTLPKQVSPSSPITSDGGATTCFYNGTVLSAELYTRMNATYPGAGQGQGGAGGAGAGFGGGAGASYTPWPFAVQVQQLATGEQGVPDCYRLVNGAVGERVSVESEEVEEADECSCVYQNFDAST
ncbi:hypothetical protein EV356DRAFT_515800 [Viridothelium virens]|uniref:Tat pathway signal sequence n=1 Tax=Viridothelium virens TaxID=1048519 RepID=A0A6A6H8D1_VIRVR|nr:hypothetical protein EV356DRAFT_515800 [Viridothelium virens]